MTNINWPDYYSDKDARRVGEGKPPGVQHVGQLPTDVETAARNGGDVPVDGRFHRDFVLQDFDPKSDNEATHTANVVAMHNEAMMRGLSPQDMGRFEGVIDTPDGSYCLRYSVPVVPAHEAPTVITPADVIKAKKK